MGWGEIAMAGLSAFSASQSKPKGLRAPSGRSYLGEMQESLNAQNNIQGQSLQQEAYWTPAWQQLQEQTLMGQMGNLNNLYGKANEYSSGLQNSYIGMQTPIYGKVGESARSAYQKTLDPTTAGLYSTMANQAQEGLNNGTGLSAQETQLGQQSARAGMAARGMQFGNQAIAAEVLNSYNLGQTRQNQNRAFAGSVYGIGQQNASQAMSMYGNPMMSNLNQMNSSNLINTSGQMSGSLGSKLFTPESQYGSDLYGANQSNTAQYALGNAQMSSGYNSGIMSMVGSLGSSYLKNPNFVGKSSDS